MTDADHARFCDQLYGSASDVAVHESCMGFRGSKTIEDWILDFLAFPLFDLETRQDEKLGPVCAGFLTRAMDVYPEAAKFSAGRPYSLTGHSLGGAIAVLVGGLLTAAGRPPTEIVTFGAPRVGFSPLVAVLASVPIRAYRFGHDPVTEVPTPPFLHVRALLPIGKAVYPLFANHHIGHYIGALHET